MSLSATALISIDEAKSFLKMTNESDVPALEQIIDGVSTIFHGMVDCALQSAEHTAVALDGTGKTYLYLPWWPVTVMGDVVENGSTLVEDSDFTVDMDFGILEKTRQVWPELEVPTAKWTTLRKGVVVTCTAGYATLPQDIQMALKIQVQTFFQKYQHKSWDETSRSQAGSSVSVSDEELLPIVTSVLAKYVRPRI